MPEFRRGERVVETGERRVIAVLPGSIETLARTRFDQCRHEQPVDDFLGSAAHADQLAQVAGIVAAMQRSSDHPRLVMNCKT